MKRIFVRPRVVVSKCLGFAPCRYNGMMTPSPLVERLAAYADMVPVCMEVEIGLGVPRGSIRVVQTAEGLRLMQPSSGTDVSDIAMDFTKRYLEQLENVDGFIMKSRSPSCGIKDVKVYPVGDKVASITAKGSGFFGGEIVSKFGHLAIEDDARLLNLRIGEHFLTKLFTLADFRYMKEKGDISSLIDFHARHKLLLMYYNQKEMRALGALVANREHHTIDVVLEQYAIHLSSALARPPRCGSANNVLMHAMGYFSEQLNAEEKKMFLEELELYRQGKVPMTAPLGILRSWIARFNTPYLHQQSFLQPFPEEFLELMSNDACVGRDMWSNIVK